jgi:hypothetical protein
MSHKKIYYVAEGRIVDTAPSGRYGRDWIAVATRGGETLALAVAAMYDAEQIALGGVVPSWSTAASCAGLLFDFDDLVPPVQIAALSDEAATAGDFDQVKLCISALEGDEDAISECARVLEAAADRALEDARGDDQMPDRDMRRRAGSINLAVFCDQLNRPPIKGQS